MSDPLIKRNPPADGSTMAIGAVNTPSTPHPTPHPTPRPAGQIEIAAPLEEGSRIGPYEVREHIGDGGMAAVYKVWHTGLHRFEALKIPRYQASRGPEADFLHRLLAEARTAASLQHPNIVAIHNVSDEKSVLHYFAMELVQGSDLAALIDGNPLPFEQALEILRQIGSALDYAHEHGVVHRDIKPANILLEQTEAGHRARVVDFGISRAGEEDGSTRLTRSGMIVGTPEYMSPEQSGSGAPVDHRTDVYSLGVVAYEMLCGQPPFVAGDGVSRMSVLMKQINEVPDSLDKCRPDLPPVAAKAIAKALAKNPDERFSSCTAFVEALAAAPPLEEQQNALLTGGAKPLRRTMGALFGTPTLAVGDKPRTLNIGNETSSFTAPLPVKLAHAVTRPLSLIAACIGLLAGTFLLWNLRQPTQNTPVAKPVATPLSVIPVVTKQTTPQPTPTKKPNPTPTKPVSVPVVPKVPVKTTPKAASQKIVKKPTAAKPLQKSIVRKAPSKSARKPATKKPTSRRAVIRKPIKRNFVRRRVVRKPVRPKSNIRRRSAQRSPSYSGGEAGLPP